MNRHLPEQLITTPELAERIGVDPTTIRQWVREGRLPAIRLARKCVRFSWPAVCHAIGVPASDIA